MGGTTQIIESNRTMVLPEFNEAGDLPLGVHQATLEEVVSGLVLLMDDGAFALGVCCTSTHWLNARGAFGDLSSLAVTLLPSQARTTWM